MSPTVKISALKDTEVFNPIKVGRNQLEHRVIFAPTTRYRSLDDHTPSDLNLQYYRDRTKTKGSLVITEATFVSPQAGGYANVPGIWTEGHVKAWKKITDEVHKNGSFIAVQGWFLGRRGNPAVLKAEGQEYVGASAIYNDDDSKKLAIEAGNPIRSLTEEQIHDLVYEVYPNAARKAMEAGFDYFEIHGAHGYLLDTFFHPASNKRTDRYGGSVENRCRLFLEIVDQLIQVIGADRLAIRISPWATSPGILGHKDIIHPISTHSYLLHELQKRADAGNQLAYISIVEPRVSGSLDVPEAEQTGSNEFASLIWKGVLLKSGNYTYDAPSFNTLKRDTANARTLVGFSRYYISNPDLVERLYHGHNLEPYDRNLFYSKTNYGYNTYGRYGEESNYDKETEVKRIAQEI